jgi:hypothetical protein
MICVQGSSDLLRRHLKDSLISSLQISSRAARRHVHRCYKRRGVPPLRTGRFHLNFLFQFLPLRLGAGLIQLHVFVSSVRRLCDVNLIRGYYHSASTVQFQKSCQNRSRGPGAAIRIYFNTCLPCLSRTKNKGTGALRTSNQ